MPNDNSVDSLKSFLYASLITRKDPMSTAHEYASPTLQDLDPTHVVRIERQGRVWNVTVPMSLQEAQVQKVAYDERLAARLKVSKDPWDHVSQRYFVARIQYEEIA